MKNIKYKSKILMIIIFTLVGIFAGYHTGNFIVNHWYRGLYENNQSFYDVMKLFFSIATASLFGIACLFIFKDDLKK